MIKEFECHWEHPRYFSVIKIKNMVALFKNLGIQLLKVSEEKEKRRTQVTFSLAGTEMQEKELNYYMEKIKALS